MQKTKKHSFLYRNGLTLFFLVLFLTTLVAQALTGWKTNNNELTEIGGRALSFRGYLHSGHFISATFENFQSEFLQMGLYVLMTVGLRQLGSAESKPLDKSEETDREPVAKADAPAAVRRGGWQLWLYKRSLSFMFLLLFLISWALHLYGSWLDHNVQEQLSGKPAETILQFIGEPDFWFQIFQNWQSEFISIVSIVFLTIYLRQQGSPESKPVDAPHLQTGK
jgi:hypothetical protein